MIHELKIWPQFYVRVADGSKTFEIRENDRAFQSGDTVVLKEFDPTPINSTSDRPKGYTDSPPLTFRIGYIHVLSKSEVVFSLLPPAELFKEPNRDLVRPEKPPKDPRRRKG